MTFATTRSEIADALFALCIQTPGIVNSSRKFIMWDQVAPTDMPFMTMLRVPGATLARKGVRSANNGLQARAKIVKHH